MTEYTTINNSASRSIIDEKTFISIVKQKVRKTVAITASKYTHFSSMDKEDMVQDILIKLWSSRERFNPEVASLGTWASLAAYNYVIDQQDKWMHNGLFEVSLSNRPGDDEKYDEEGGLRAPTRKGGVPDDLSDEDYANHAEQAISAVHDALAKMSPSDRKVLKMVMNGYSGKEMAEDLNTTVDAVYIRVHKAKKRFAAVYDGPRWAA